jgi:hypothetical protein
MKRLRPVRRHEPALEAGAATLEDGGPAEPNGSGLSRRLLLTRGSLGVVAAGVVSALPALPAAVNTAEVEAPDASEMVSDTDAIDGSLVAQVKNLQTGEVSLYSGAREISIVDRALAARLFNAAR